MSGKIYVNSYFKDSGSDTKFKVSIAPIYASQLALDAVSCDVLWSNFYQSQRDDFRTFAINIRGADGVIRTY